MKVTMQETKGENFKSTNAVDGKHYAFACKKCGVDLCDVWVNYPDQPVTTKMIALCGHCDGRSYEQTISGLFAIGHNTRSEKCTNIDGYDYNIDGVDVIVKTSKK